MEFNSMIKDALKNVSIRGRVAYLICLFENLLLYYKYNMEEWKWILEKLWSYTKIQYIDDWMYELAEYMPNSILEDDMEDAEYITKEESEKLYTLYSNSNTEVLWFLKIIYECGTCEIYSRLCDYSINTLQKVEQAMELLRKKGIELADAKPFEAYSFNEGNGWGNCFENRNLSKFI